MNGEWESDQSKLIQQILQDGAEAEADLFQDKFRESIKITDIAIQKIPYIEYPGLSKEENKELHLLEQRLLQTAKEVNLHREVSITLRLDRENFSSDEERIALILGEEHEVDLLRDTKTYHLINSTHDVVVVNLHNHPGGATFSGNDIHFFLSTRSVKMLILLSNKGKVEFIQKTDKYDRAKCMSALRKITKQILSDKKGVDGTTDIDKAILSVKDLLTITKRWIKEAKNYGILYGDTKKYKNKEGELHYGIPH